MIALVGAAATLGLDQLWLAAWASSGTKFSMGQRTSIHLPKGQSLVYYESPYSVPKGDATLRLWDPDGERMRVGQPDNDISYRLLLGGSSGRALWRLDIPEEDDYAVLCSNHNFTDDKLIPAEDRVVFLKSPDSLEEVNAVRRVLLVAGGTATFVLAALCYVLHFIALRKRRMAPAA